MTKSGDCEEGLIMLSSLPVLWLTMTEYGYLDNPTIEMVALTLTLTVALTVALTLAPTRFINPYLIST